MTRNEAIERIKAERRAGHCCVKSWRDEHKIVDFELIDNFMAQGGDENTIEEFELLDLEQLWGALTALDPDNLSRVATAAGEVIDWSWTDKDGSVKKNSFPFSPEGIMTIMNDEFFA